MRVLTLALAVLIVPAISAAQTTVPVPQFRSVELRNGGMVILRHGPTQRVTLLQGSLQQTSVTVDGDWLVIDRPKSVPHRGYRLEIEVVTPWIAEVSVQEGGTLQSRGAFPPQASIEASVSNGGTLDIRSIETDNVEAAVSQGGRIFLKAGQSLVASVNQGGIITWWGDARVRRSVRHGGAVVHGTAADADKPLSDLGLDHIPPLPPIPPVPPSSD